MYRSNGVMDHRRDTGHGVSAILMQKVNWLSEPVAPTAAQRDLSIASGSVETCQGSTRLDNGNFGVSIVPECLTLDPLAALEIIGDTPLPADLGQ